MHAENYLGFEEDFWKSQAKTFFKEIYEEIQRSFPLKYRHHFRGNTGDPSLANVLGPTVPVSATSCRPQLVPLSYSLFLMDQTQPSSEGSLTGKCNSAEVLKFCGCRYRPSMPVQKLSVSVAAPCFGQNIPPPQPHSYSSCQKSQHIIGHLLKLTN